MPTPPQSPNSEPTPKTLPPNKVGPLSREEERAQESQARLLEIRQLFSSPAWGLLSTELESLSQWYLERMVQATNHDEMIRYQAKVQVLKYLFGGTLEQQALAQHQTATTTIQPYMDADAYGTNSEESIQ